MPPSRFGIGPRHRAAPRRLPAAGELMEFPCRELKGSGEQNDHAGRERNSAGQRRLLHLDVRQGYAHGKDDRPKHCPDEEVAQAYERG